MVMLSDPEAIRALYTERGHGLPPGRTVSLRPIMGARSRAAARGRRAPGAPQLMLPPFHGERMRAYEPIVREVAERELATLAGATAVRRAPAACRRSRSR